MKIATNPEASPRSQGVPTSPVGCSGFTLVELLVCVAILLVLGTIGGSIYGGMAQKAAQVREVHAAKTLVGAFTSYTLENNGKYMAAHDATARGYTLPDGKTMYDGSTRVSDIEAHRYPMRLAPYFNYQVREIILVNNIEKQLKGLSFPSRLYGASLYPSLGINFKLVGGHYTANGNKRQLNCAEDVLTQVSQGAALLVFASAAQDAGEKRVNGYEQLLPPNLDKPNWSARAGQWTKEANPSQYGNIDFRYDGKAVCAFLDGRVVLQSAQDLNDMRLWSRNALSENNPDYRLQPDSGGVGSGRL